MTFNQKVNEQRTLLERLGFSSSPKSCAINLGCGPGFQSLALSDLGYESVIALDTSQVLLDELSAASQGPSIKTVHADLRAFPAHVGNGDVNAIVRMGDTLIHLENCGEVSRLFENSYRTLRPDGLFALTFRGFSNELTDLDCFTPVRSDDSRIMLCALLYETTSVVVTDLVYSRSNSAW